jgi:hypothetical protein
MAQHALPVMDMRKQTLLDIDNQQGGLIRTHQGAGMMS